MLMGFVVALFVAFVVATLVIRYAHWHGRFTQDSTEGVQKFHSGPTPRIGGAPLFLGLLSALAVTVALGGMDVAHATWIVLAILPVYLAGIAEDVTKKVGPLWRLLAAFASAGIGTWLFGGMLLRLDLPMFDPLLASFPAIAFVLTLVAVGGVCHAMNIIDGYNGLSGVVAAMILGALAYVAWKVGDSELLAMAVLTIGAIIGFLIWNYPRGLIFAGDGGAYLLGFMIAEISVLLVFRHPQVSPWFPLLLVGYPVWETLFSVYRRTRSGRSAGLPDALHMHQIIFRRLVRWMVGSREAQHLLKRNSMTSPYLWAVAATTVVPAVLLWEHTIALQISFVIFALSYVWLYQRIVRFRSPKLLVVGGNARGVRSPKLKQHEKLSVKRG